MTATLIPPYAQPNAAEVKLAKVREIAAAGSAIAGMVVFLSSLLPADDPDVQDLEVWKSTKELLDAIVKAVDE